MWFPLLIAGFVISKIYCIRNSSVQAFLGCYSDSLFNSQAVTDTQIFSVSNTRASCANYCDSLHMAYSASKNANECYCLQSAPAIPSVECTTPCAGDSTSICGGEDTMSVVFSNITTLTVANSTKRGLCWLWDNPPVVYDYFSPSAIPWLYNWQLFDLRKNGTYAGAEFVPMCATELDAHVMPLAFSTCHGKYLLGFNEPDIPPSEGGSLLTPYNASVLWKKYIQPIKEKCGLLLGAPAVSASFTPDKGLHWLRQFFGNCTAPSCTFDFIPFHWYGYPLSNFQAYVEKFHGTYPNDTLWITEWQFGGQSAEETAILEQQALQWLDSQPYIARYAMFAPSTAELMNYVPNGAMVKSDFSGLTDVGKIYAGLM